jgi:hypothetical protein
MTKKIELTTVGKLTHGDFAITQIGKMAVMCVSSGSFTPKFAGEANVVRLSNGIGGYLCSEKCRIVSPEEAFARALREIKPQ